MDENKKMADETKRPLTEEERRIVSAFLDGIEKVYFEDDDAYDRQEWQKFKARQLADNTDEEIEAFVEICKDNDGGFNELCFLMMYDMWYNRSPIWPVPAGYVEARNKEKEREIAQMHIQGGE